MDQVKIENLSSDESDRGEKRKSPQQPGNNQTEPKKTRSDFWDGFEKFTDEDGKKKGRCKHCSKALAADSYKNGTSSMKTRVKSCLEHPDSQKPTSDGETDNEQVTQNLSSDDEYVHEEPDLSMLKPPSRSDGFSTEKEVLDVLKVGSLSLISDIKKATDANRMIYLSSKAFACFDAFKIDYTPLYKAVRAVIRQQLDKETLAKQKPQDAFDIKAAYDQAASESSKAEERYSGINRVSEDAQNELDAIDARCKRLHDEVKKAKEEKAKWQVKFATAKADKVTCDKACSKAKSKVKKIARERNEAQKTVDEYEKRCQEIDSEFNHAMEELSSFRSSLP